MILHTYVNEVVQEKSGIYSAWKLNDVFFFFFSVEALDWCSDKTYWPGLWWSFQSRFKESQVPYQWTIAIGQLFSPFYRLWSCSPLFATGMFVIGFSMGTPGSSFPGVFHSSNLLEQKYGVLGKVLCLIVIQLNSGRTYYIQYLS